MTFTPFDVYSLTLEDALIIAQQHKRVTRNEMRSILIIQACREALGFPDHSGLKFSRVRDKINEDDEHFLKKDLYYAEAVYEQVIRLRENVQARDAKNTDSVDRATVPHKIDKIQKDLKKLNLISKQKTENEQQEPGLGDLVTILNPKRGQSNTGKIENTLRSKRKKEKLYEKVRKSA